MERLTLTPQSREIIVNNGSLEGAVDLFSYGPEPEQALRPLGSLYVVGHRDTDSSNVSYMVSLIAAMARREYYARPGEEPREAFTRALRKINEVVDEFFKSSGVNLSVGVFAIAGGTILVSKLDKFKLLLAREGQVIDILNNVVLFSKEHVQKRQFSSIISGSVQPGDRILAYYPSKGMTTRERHIKTCLVKMGPAVFSQKLTDIGQEHPSFAAALLYVDMVQLSESAERAPWQPRELAAPAQVDAQLAWKPRQHSVAATVAPAQQPEAEQEIPHIIPTEFSLGTRRSSMGRLLGRVRFVRLDGRGKAVFLAACAVIVIGGVLAAKSVFYTSPEGQKTRQLIQGINTDVQLAKSKIAENRAGEARQLLVRALSTLTGAGLGDDKDARALTASIVSAMDSLDNAQDASLSLTAQLDPQTDRLVVATWSSVSQSLWAVTAAPDETISLIRITDGLADSRAALNGIQPSAVLPFKSGLPAGQAGALVLDAAARKIVRILNDAAKSYTIPTQETILSASSYESNIYVLTDKSILKVSDLDTAKPVTKQWLLKAADLASGAARLYVDGTIYTLGRDGMLTTYYKGKRSAQVQVPLDPSGAWELAAGPQEGQLAVMNTDTKRIYIIAIKDGSLVRTLKLDVQQPLLQMLGGPNDSVLFITKDNKVWEAK